MQDVSQALGELKELYRKVVGTPAPEVKPGAFLPFPPGVDPLRHAVEEVSMLRRMSQGLSTAPVPVAWVPRADCYGSKDCFLIRLEIPGVSRDDLKVLVAGGEVVVRGERRPPDPEKLTPLLVEQPFGAFERRFTLPAGARSETVSARYAEGVLELRIDGEATEIPGEMTVEVA